MGRELSDISCWAAVGVDNILLKKAKEIDYKNINNLIRFIETEPLPENSTLLFSLADTVWTPNQLKGKTTKDVISEAKALEEKLKSVQNSPKEELMLLRNYCVRLTTNATKYECVYSPRYLAA